MALERGLKGRDQLLKLVQGQAREIQERHRAGLQLGKPYTSHGSCLLLLYRDVRGTSYQKESGINSCVTAWHAPLSSAPLTPSHGGGVEGSAHRWAGLQRPTTSWCPGRGGSRSRVA